MAGLRTNALVATGAAVFILSAMSVLAGQPGGVLQRRSSPVSASFGAGALCVMAERPRPQYHRHAVVFGRDRRTLRPGTVLNATAATLIIPGANIRCARRRSAFMPLPGPGDEEKRYVFTRHPSART